MANEIIKGMGFHHIALKATDFDRSAAFYENVLGMKPYAAWGEGDGRALMLDLGDGGILELFAGGDGFPAAGKYLHLALRADDIDAAFEAALAGGATVVSAPATVELKATPHPITVRCAFVEGLDGEQIEFFKQL